MIPAGAGSPRRYRLTYLPAVRTALTDLLRDAAAAGIWPECVTALAAIERRLRSAPLGFGELVRERPLLRLIEHVGSRPPITVRFGIHQDEPVVIIIELFLRPASL